MEKMVTMRWKRKQKTRQYCGQWTSHLVFSLLFFQRAALQVRFPQTESDGSTINKCKCYESKVRSYPSYAQNFSLALIPTQGKVNCCPGLLRVEMRPSLRSRMKSANYPAPKDNLFLYPLPSANIDSVCYCYIVSILFLCCFETGSMQLCHGNYYVDQIGLKLCLPLPPGCINNVSVLYFLPSSARTFFHFSFYFLRQGFLVDLAVLELRDLSASQALKRKV